MARKPTNRPPKSAVYPFRIEERKLREFEKVALKNHRSIAQQLRVLVDQYIDAHKDVA